MKPVEIIEIFVPSGEEFGWVRTRGRWGGISTFLVDHVVLEGMAEDVLAEPETPAAMDPRYAMRSRDYASSWPPTRPALIWVVREDRGGGKTLWVKHSRG